MAEQIPFGRRKPPEIKPLPVGPGQMSYPGDWSQAPAAPSDRPAGAGSGTLPKIPKTLSMRRMKKTPSVMV